MIYWSKANNFGEGGIQAMIWSKEETLPRSEIEAIQLTKLKETVRYIYDRVKPYRDNRSPDFLQSSMQTESPCKSSVPK